MSNVFKNIPSGNYKVTTAYKAPDFVQSNILLKDDFGQGKDVPIPEIPKNGYIFVDQEKNPDHQVDDGEYTVTKKLVKPANTWYPDLSDHTGNLDGRMLVVNVGPYIEGIDDLIYKKEIRDIIHNQDLEISFWIINLFKSSAGQQNPDLLIQLVDDQSRVIGEYSTHNIGIGPWELIKFKVNPGENDRLYFVIRTLSHARYGNDLAMDDLKIDQKPLLCDYEVETAVNVDLSSVADPKQIGISYPSCFGKADGTVTIQAESRFAPYQYSLNNGISWISVILGANSDFIINNLDKGNHVVLVRASANTTSPCDHKIEVIITEPDEIAVKPTVIIPESCRGKADGSITFEISRGKMPYSTVIMLENSDISIEPKTKNGSSVTFEGLESGNYKIVITDNGGCIKTSSVTLPLSPGFNPRATVIYNCEENNHSSNRVEISVNPDTKNKIKSYSLLNKKTQQKIGNPQASNIFYNLPPGTYIVKLNDDCYGCNEQTASFEIETVSALKLEFAKGGLNDISAVVTGGRKPYHYYFNDNDNENNSVYRIKETGIYTVKVVDAAGCEVIDEIHEEFIDIHIPNFFTPNDDGYNDTWGPENTQNYPKIKIRIFDRYGREIKILEPGQTWDGKLNAVPLPSGDYWYIMRLNDNEDTREFVGNITIYR